MMNSTGHGKFEQVFLDGKTIRIKVEPDSEEDDTPIFGDYPVENIKVEPELLFKDEPQSDSLEDYEMPETSQEIKVEEMYSEDDVQSVDSSEASCSRVTRKRGRDGSTQLNTKSSKHLATEFGKMAPSLNITVKSSQNEITTFCAALKNDSNNVIKFKRKDQYKECKLCSNKYTTYDALNKHINNIHRSAQCDECSETFYTDRGLKIHKTQRHYKNSLNRPNLYPKLLEFKTKISDIKKQINLLINEISLRKKIESIGHLNFTIYCIKCSQDYVEKTYFQFHLENCIKKSSNKKFNCSFCGGIKTNTNIYNHIKTHLNKAITYCNFCDMSFFTKYNFQCHFDKYHKIASTLRSPASNLPPAVTILDKDHVESNNCVLEVPDIEVVDTECKSSILELKNDIENNSILIKASNISIFCNECKQEYNIITYIYHIINCCKNLLFKCTFCSNFSNTYTVLEYLNHIKIHFKNAKKLFICSFCNINFVNHGNYKLHCLNEKHAIKYY